MIEDLADHDAVKVAVGLLSLITVACASPEPSGAPPIAGPPHVDRSNGRGDRVGSGLAFVVDALAISEADRSPVRRSLRGPGLPPQLYLAPWGKPTNDQIRQHLLGGAPLSLALCLLRGRGDSYPSRRRCHSTAPAIAIKSSIAAHSAGSGVDSPKKPVLTPCG